ncbi:MAG: Eco57I restriction-modification methylase domain-containing protein, partial [bacterium]
SSDRLIFLRICEDRGIEEYGRLMMLQNSDRVYPKLCDLFHRADERYNSGLFHFSKEKDRAESPDQLTLNIAIDDKPLKEIIKNLYYPDSAYEFAVLPADILGQVYEQFLGKVIRLTTGHRAVVEDKPEVKKAGGVYYTPTYIVDYIVKNTVGKLLENKTPKSVVQLRILDPACGSGSFLINAYQLLLDWHRDYYINEGIDKHKKELYQVAGGDYRLTTAERKRILLNNIYGVDIDPQAVEVTKLSLLLKVLEGENEQTISNQLRLFHERALPDLGNNIKCGNSLIGPDFYDNQQLNFLDDDERYRINVFDWQKEFPTIFSHENTKSTKSNPGFDAVIGNPPWGSFISDMEKKYLYEKYVNRRGEAESHLFFMEQGLKLLNKTGILGYITPNTWLSVLNSNEIRAYLLKNAAFYEITELTKYIFKDAPDIVPIVIFLGKKQANEILCMVKRTNVIKVHAGNFYDVFSIQEIPTKVWLNTPGTIINLHATTTVLRIIDRCKANSIALSAVCDVLYGIKTSDNEKYLSNIKTKTHNVKALKTGELVRFNIKWKGIYLWWCPELAGYRKSSLEIPKIVVQYIRKLSLSKRIIAALDEKGIYYPLNNYSYIAQKDLSYSLKYILGLLNSSLLNYYFANTFIDYNIKPTYLQQLPIKPIDFSDPKDKSKHDRMVELVDRMLTLHKQLASTKTPDERTALQRHIDATDSQIDRLVYELYGLTEEEIKIVEGINNV